MPKKSMILVFFIILFFNAAAVLPDATTTQTVRIGYLQSDLHQLAAFVGLKKRFFKDEGLDVQVGGVFKAGPELMSAFAAGALDTGYVGTAPAVVAAANNVAQVKIVAQVNLEGSAIVVGSNSPIRRLKDLEGKTVAVPGYGQVQDFLLRLALSNDKIPQDRVKTIIIKPPEMIPTLSSRQIDAFLAWEPYPAKAVTSGVGRVLSYSRTIWPKHPCCVVAVHDNFVHQHPEAVLQLVRAHIKATQYIQNNRQEALKLAQEFTGMDERTVRLGLDSLVYEYVINKQGILQYARFLKDLEIIKLKDAEQFVNSLADETYVERTLRNK